MGEEILKITTSKQQSQVCSQVTFYTFLPVQSAFPTPVPVPACKECDSEAANPRVPTPIQAGGVEAHILIS